MNILSLYFFPSNTWSCACESTLCSAYP